MELMFLDPAQAEVLADQLLVFAASASYDDRLMLSQGRDPKVLVQAARPRPGQSRDVLYPDPAGPVEVLPNR